ncbi:MAG: hypothetical protein Q7U77_13665 [Sediminibacterium sp.]|uniref:hypothetical protein n=1 Tax=Sediminibacterium sp. TaxID=1917865 RepID=UPI002729341F|nr:hypothetical protein [Sediminibacterium sp.]MDO8997667.1 hypothetical protein [Sediminibacterium sp.]
MKEEFDIKPLISDDRKTVGSAQRDLFCPICKCINSHINPPFLMVDENWHGNGELAVTPIWSECGSEWQICIGSHKGFVPIFVRIIKSCQAPA